jgi:hypothetical protein
MKKILAGGVEVPFLFFLALSTEFQRFNLVWVPFLLVRLFFLLAPRGYYNLEQRGFRRYGLAQSELFGLVFTMILYSGYQDCHLRWTSKKYVLLLFTTLTFYELF